ncbi:MAG: glycosyltransferase, partial [Verrucomicrobia bacterium]|nr:glycosyltransferase [Verrucomicrobiota bacterium]
FKMRVFKASSYDHKVLSALFGQKESPLREDYASSLDGLLSSVFVGTDFWSRAFSEGSGLELMEVVLNCKPLQAQWAAENGVVVEGDDWMSRILCEQVRRFDPEVLIFHDQEYLDADFQAEVLRQCRPRLVVAWDGIARCDPSRFANCQLVLTNFPFVRDFYRAAGLRSEVLPYSFHSDIAGRIGALERIYPLTFAGSLVVRSDLHVRRLRLVGELAKRFPLTVRATGSILQWKWKERTQRRRLRHFHWSEAMDIHRLGRANLGAVHGLPMYRFFGESLVTFNVHIDNARNVASNMRLFEASGMGACLLTDGADGMEDYFEPDREVVLYGSPAEAVEKARWLLDNPEKARAIGDAGFQRTMKDHTFQKRIPLLESLLRA